MLKKNLNLGFKYHECGSNLASGGRGNVDSEEMVEFYFRQ